MRLLIDTHLLIWAGTEPGKLTAKALTAMADPGDTLLFSAVSVAEVAIKQALGKPDFQIDPRQFRHLLILNGYVELPFGGDHALPLATLPMIHRDPFDRMLIAQAIAEDIRLVSADTVVATYGAMVLPV